MAITTKISGYIRRYDGDSTEKGHRFSITETMTEGGSNRIVVAPGSQDISIMPHGLISAKLFFLETDNKINVTINSNASFDIQANGPMFMNASLNAVILKNKSATVDATILYDLSG